MSRHTRRLAAAILLGTSLTLAPASADAVDAFAPAPHDHIDRPVRDGFVLATFNVLGAGHTPPGSGWADGSTRMRWAVEKLREYDVDVVGFQEFEPSQKETFLEEVDNSWGVFSGSRVTRDSIAWKKSEFEFIRGRAVMIPYFYGKLMPMPVVVLKSRVSGQRMFFANFHLPASTKRRGDHERWRDAGTRRQIVLAHNLRSKNRAVFITGDMNEREEHFCALTANGDMHASNGGSNVDGVCRPPTRPDRTRIDWIYGSTGVEFSGYVADETTLTDGIADHPIVVTHVH